MSRRYISQARVALLAETLTSREKAIVATLAQHRMATTLQLKSLHFHRGTPQSNARLCVRTLKRLGDLGVLVHLDRRIGGERAGSAGFIWTLDVAGQRLARSQDDEPRQAQRPWTPSRQFVRHRLAITELYVRLIEAERRGQLELVEFQPEPKSWRWFFGPGGERAVLKPDALVRLGAGEWEDSWFIEVNMATESSRAIARKLETYRLYWATGQEQNDHGVFPKVLWLVPSNARYQFMVDVISQQPTETWRLYAVSRFENAIRTVSEQSRAGEEVSIPPLDGHLI